jgi:7,8-dihydro-6-hydroxymethylpterin-pyrophosphokinase
MIVNTPELIIPHPHMTKRRFVLQPLNDLAPDLRHPENGLSVSQLLMSLDTDEAVIQI